jgi:hypothetical protein
MQNSQKTIITPSNPFTTNLTINTLNQFQQIPNHQKQQTPHQESQGRSQFMGESSNTSQQNTQQSKLPEFFVYPEGIVKEGVEACNRSIIGKIITGKSIHVNSIQNGLESIWGAPSGLKVQEIEGKLLQFFIDKEEDQDRILLGNPWIFRNSWLIVKPHGTEKLTYSP